MYYITLTIKKINEYYDKKEQELMDMLSGIENWDIESQLCHNCLKNVHVLQTKILKILLHISR